MEPDELSRVFGALASPVRRSLLLRLELGDATVRDLCEPFAISRPAISRHLAVLDSAGLIHRVTRTGTVTNNSMLIEPFDVAFRWLDERRASI